MLILFHFSTYNTPKKSCGNEKLYTNTININSIIFNHKTFPVCDCYFFLNLGHPQNENKCKRFMQQQPNKKSKNNNYKKKLFSSSNCNYIKWTRSVRGQRKHDKPNVCDTFQSRAPSVDVLVSSG